MFNLLPVVNRLSVSIIHCLITFHDIVSRLLGDTVLARDWSCSRYNLQNVSCLWNLNVFRLSCVTECDLPLRISCWTVTFHSINVISQGTLPGFWTLALHPLLPSLNFSKLSENHMLQLNIWTSRRNIGLCEMTSLKSFNYTDYSTSLYHFDIHETEN